MVTVVVRGERAYVAILLERVWRQGPVLFCVIQHCDLFIQRPHSRQRTNAGFGHLITAAPRSAACAGRSSLPLYTRGRQPRGEGPYNHVARTIGDLSLFSVHSGGPNPSVRRIGLPRAQHSLMCADSTGTARLWGTPKPQTAIPNHTPTVPRSLLALLPRSPSLLPRSPS